MHARKAAENSSTRRRVGRKTRRLLTIPPTLFGEIDRDAGQGIPTERSHIILLHHQKRSALGYSLLLRKFICEADFYFGTKCGGDYGDGVNGGVVTPCFDARDVVVGDTGKFGEVA